MLGAQRTTHVSRTDGLLLGEQLHQLQGLVLLGAVDVLALLLEEVQSEPVRVSDDSDPLWPETAQGLVDPYAFEGVLQEGLLV